MGKNTYKKNLSIKTEPMKNTNKRTKPPVKIAADMTERFPDVSIPNIPHGLREASIGIAVIHKATAIKATTTYFIY